MSRPWSSTSLRHLLDEKILDDPQQRVKVGRGGGGISYSIVSTVENIFGLNPAPYECSKRCILCNVCPCLEITNKSFSSVFCLYHEQDHDNLVVKHHHHCLDGWEEARV